MEEGEVVEESLQSRSSPAPALGKDGKELEEGEIEEGEIPEEGSPALGSPPRRRSSRQDRWSEDDEGGYWSEDQRRSRSWSRSPPHSRARKRRRSRSPQGWRPRDSDELRDFFAELSDAESLLRGVPESSTAEPLVTACVTLDRCLGMLERLSAHAEGMTSQEDVEEANRALAALVRGLDKLFNRVRMVYLATSEDSSAAVTSRVQGIMARVAALKCWSAMQLQEVQVWQRAAPSLFTALAECGPVHSPTAAKGAPGSADGWAKSGSAADAGGAADSGENTVTLWCTCCQCPLGGAHRWPVPWTIDDVLAGQVPGATVILSHLKGKKHKKNSRGAEDDHGLVFRAWDGTLLSETGDVLTMVAAEEEEVSKQPDRSGSSAKRREKKKQAAKRAAIKEKEGKKSGKKGALAKLPEKPPEVLPPATAQQQQPILPPAAEAPPSQIPISYQMLQQPAPFQQQQQQQPPPFQPQLAPNGLQAPQALPQMNQATPQHLPYQQPGLPGQQPQTAMQPQPQLQPNLPPGTQPAPHMQQPPLGTGAFQPQPQLGPPALGPGSVQPPAFGGPMQPQAGPPPGAGAGMGTSMGMGMPLGAPSRGYLGGPQPVVEAGAPPGQQMMGQRGTQQGPMTMPQQMMGNPSQGMGPPMHQHQPRGGMNMGATQPHPQPPPRMNMVQQQQQQQPPHGPMGRMMPQGGGMGMGPPPTGLPGPPAPPGQPMRPGMMPMHRPGPPMERAGMTRIPPGGRPAFQGPGAMHPSQPQRGPHPGPLGPMRGSQAPPPPMMRGMHNSGPHRPPPPPMQRMQRQPPPMNPRGPPPPPPRTTSAAPRPAAATGAAGVPDNKGPQQQKEPHQESAAHGHAAAPSASSEYPETIEVPLSDDEQADMDGNANGGGRHQGSAPGNGTYNDFSPVRPALDPESPPDSNNRKSRDNLYEEASYEAIGGPEKTAKNNDGDSVNGAPGTGAAGDAAGGSASGALLTPPPASAAFPAFLEPAMSAKSKELLMRLGGGEVQPLPRRMHSLIGGGRLALVLDLDHTLVNSVRFDEVDAQQAQILRAQVAAVAPADQRQVFQLDTVGMWTKLRPGVRKFLATTAKAFQLWIHTNGNRPYAEAIADLLDPSGELFSGRIIAQDADMNDTTSQVKSFAYGLEGLESVSLIVDDSLSVWPGHADNLFPVERYVWFPSSRRRLGLPGASLMESGRDECQDRGMLAVAGEVLLRVHSSVFRCVKAQDADELNEQVVSVSSGRSAPWDVREALKGERRKVLAGCVIMFTRAIPLGQEPNSHPLWQLAERFGATCLKVADEQVTHVVAGAPGTEKGLWAQRTGRLVVQPSWLEASCMLWMRAWEPDHAVQSAPAQTT